MSDDHLRTMRHTAEHVLHQAVKELYPDIQLAMGPATDEGFYFDFDSSPVGKKPVKISEADFPAIEKKMRRIISQNMPVTRHEISVEEAHRLFADNPYKQEWIEKAAAADEAITVYWTGIPDTPGSMVDLCAGPHVASTGEVKAFKLLSVAGAYWHGDEKNKMLTRIYGTAYFSKEDLDAYLHMMAEAKKRDHRKLGSELDLFTFSEYVGSGLPLYTPKGALVRKLLNEYIEGIQSQEGYSQVWTPQIAKAELFKKSGHYDKYHEDMFRVVSHYSDEEMYLKPMNCPQHTQIYASKPRSYRDLPIRYTDFAMLYRDERPGQLSGLARVRSFSQDDCHVFCREDQVDEEIDRMLTMTKRAMATFGFKYKYRLSTRDPQAPEKYLGDPAQWDRVEKWAETIMKRNGIEYYDAPGEASFYAPKMDLMATDAIGRQWQLSTVQIDYVQPARFELAYVDRDGKEKMPVMIHRAILGSTERLMMVLIEHYAGAFPMWLAPVQVALLPLGEGHIEYARSVELTLTAAGIRVSVDADAKTIGAKIRHATLQKIPYMAIIGDREVDSGSLSVRSREGQDLGSKPVADFTSQFKTAIENHL